MSAEPTANVYMSREFMLQFTSRSGNKPWLKRRELEDKESDPSVLEMIKAIQPLMGPRRSSWTKSCTRTGRTRLRPFANC